MNIFSNTVVTLSYKLFSTAGELIENRRNRSLIAWRPSRHFPEDRAALAQKKWVTPAR
jgi:hypothetical protein